MRRRHVSLHYCSGCRMTTRHAETEATSTCLRCGTAKHLNRVVKTATPHEHDGETGWN
ncbi:MAG TPA: hypothetical protein VGP72_08585 [Planctomycetota bacterium]